MIADLPPAPSRTVSWTVSAALAAAWIAIRAVAFDTLIFPLTYALPLLICVWTRDRLALWLMAALFVAVHTVKLYWLLPPDVLSDEARLANMTATLMNITLGVAVVEALLRLRGRLERALHDVHEQADELRAQSEELAQQNEELTEQSEELSQQGEELASQNEELRTLSDEVGTLNAALQRREHLLVTLLETARLSGSEQAALGEIAKAALELFGDPRAAAAVYEAAPSGLRLTALTGGAATPADATRDRADAFAQLVFDQVRTAAINDLSLRTDLAVPALPDAKPVRAAIGAPIRLGDRCAGVFIIYSPSPREWSDEDFRLAEWLADQSARTLQALRVQTDLREADRRKNEFLATLSHELRNPLAPIRFALKLIEQGQTQDGQAVKIMGRQFQQLVRLVDDLLDATRISSNKIQLRKQRTDLTAIVQQAVDAARPEIDAAGHTLTVELPPAPIWLDADPDRLAQVVANLLNNATRYTPPGGRLTVRAAVRDGRAAVTVRDSGIGLSPADLSNVFEMFTQIGGPGSGGLGIGLAIVKRIVDLHGGHVAARSDGPGRGCEFEVVLPVAEAAAVTAPQEPARDAAGEARRVLVVDDNTDGAAMMAAILKLHGHSVWVAHDAAGALEAAGRLALDVALLDIGLPDVDGYELARRLRLGEATSKLRLVAVTGWGQEGDRARAVAAGFDAHLTKPAEPNSILAIVSETVDPRLTDRKVKIDPQ